MSNYELYKPFRESVLSFMAVNADAVADDDADAGTDIDLDPDSSLNNDLYFDAAEYAPEDTDVQKAKKRVYCSGNIIINIQY